jgi:hypothetical protein
VTEIQPLSFGSSVFTTGSAICNLTGNNPLFSDVLADSATVITGGTTYFGVDTALTGAGCAGGGRVGIYEVVTAGPTDAITVTINAVTNADFAFNPNSNCLPEYITTSATDDVCRIMAPGTPSNVAVTGDATNFGSLANTLRFTVGGTLTTAAGGLTPSTLYSDVFNIDVIYQ